MALAKVKDLSKYPKRKKGNRKDTSLYLNEQTYGTAVELIDFMIEDGYDLYNLQGQVSLTTLFNTLVEEKLEQYKGVR